MDDYVTTNSLVHVFALESYMVFSHGLAVTSVIVTMVLRLSLGLSRGCGLGFRSLDLLVITNHNHYIATLVYKWAVKNLKKNITRKAFSGYVLLSF